MQPNLLTTSGAARILEMSEGAVRQMERRGTLPAIRTEGGVRLFDRADVERLAADREQRRRRTRGSAA